MRVRLRFENRATAFRTVVYWLAAIGWVFGTIFETWFVQTAWVVALSARSRQYHGTAVSDVNVAKAGGHFDSPTTRDT